MAEPQVTYYALLGEGRTPDDPSGIVRRTHTDPPTDEAFTRNMTWRPTEHLRRYYWRGSSDMDHVEIDSEAALRILDRWCEEWTEEDRVKRESNSISAAVIAAIRDSAVPRIERNKVLQMFGNEEGETLVNRVSELVHEAVRMPIEWGDQTLEEGVNDILRRFHAQHPELSLEALHEIGRCVGWQLR